ncbi:hypothetical protein F4777DRAFT_535496 [Nemania sp. FL0916]|nr:hypothetical protein F4777DRAFT_535496 [Nemania sp. FL0916]
MSTLTFLALSLLQGLASSAPTPAINPSRRSTLLRPGTLFNSTTISTPFPLPGATTNSSGVVITSTSPENYYDNSGAGQEGLSTGAVIGIIFGAVLLALILAIPLWIEGRRFRPTHLLAGRRGGA